MLWVLMLEDVRLKAGRLVEAGWGWDWATCVVMWHTRMTANNWPKSMQEKNQKWQKQAKQWWVCQISLNNHVAQFRCHRHVYKFRLCEMKVSYDQAVELPHSGLQCGQAIFMVTSLGRQDIILGPYMVGHMTMWIPFSYSAWKMIYNINMFHIW